MSLLSINEQKCKTCGICALTCPVYIIEKGTVGEFPRIDVQNESRCVYCGHCESVCPEKALVHQLSDTAYRSSEESSLIPDNIQLDNYFKKRRSIRNYLSKKVDTAIFEKVLDVVRFAPTGTNRQLNHWTIVSDNDKIKKLADGTIEWMKFVLQNNPDMGKKYNFPAIIIGYQLGADVICRNAPHICICSTPTFYTPGAKDAVIAAAHFELLLPSYGLGSCWAGYLMLALQNHTELKKIIELEESFTVHSVLMVGYPKFSYYSIPPAARRRRTGWPSPSARWPRAGRDGSPSASSYIVAPNNDQMSARWSTSRDIRTCSGAM